MNSTRLGAPVTAASAGVLAGCVIASMQGSTDLERPPARSSASLVSLRRLLQTMFPPGLAVFTALLAAPEGRAQAPNSPAGGRSAADGRTAAISEDSSRLE